MDEKKKLTFNPPNYDNWDEKVAAMKKANLEFEEDMKKSQEISDETLNTRFNAETPEIIITCPACREIMKKVHVQAVPKEHGGLVHLSGGEEPICGSPKVPPISKSSLDALIEKTLTNVPDIDEFYEKDLEKEMHREWSGTWDREPTPEELSLELPKNEPEDADNLDNEDLIEVDFSNAAIQERAVSVIRAMDEMSKLRPGALNELKGTFRI
jgi:hypothetical protein